MKKCLINGEFEIWLPEHRAAREQWYTPDGWEKKRLQSMHEHLSDKDLVYYVGAEEGEMPALCQMWGAKVVLIEPNEKVWPNIMAIWSANALKSPLASFCGFAGTKIYRFFDGFVENGFPQSANGEIIGNHGFKELHEAGDIPQTTIDNLPFVPTAISLDVEGSEGEVLKGAEHTLRTHHPKIWLSLHPEFYFRIYGGYQFELRKRIKDLGYKETILDYQHELHVLYE